MVKGLIEGSVLSCIFFFKTFEIRVISTLLKNQQELVSSHRSVSLTYDLPTQLITPGLSCCRMFLKIKYHI